jgi:hypothetical protein
MPPRATVELLTAGSVGYFESMHSDGDIDGGLAALHSPFRSGASCVVIVRIDGGPMRVICKGDVPSSIVEAGRITAGMTVTVHRNTERAWRAHAARPVAVTQ